jgi:hypothetical protein
VIQPGQPGHVEADGPGKQERGFKVEDDEQDRDEVEPHVELAARIFEGGKAAFVLAQLFGVRIVRAGQPETPIGRNTNATKAPRRCRGRSGSAGIAEINQTSTKG